MAEAHVRVDPQFTSNLRAVGMDGWTHWHAYIGNVLNGGTVYETTPFAKNGTPVYQLGNNYAGLGGNWDNGYALAHIYRDANWDNVTGGVVWAPASCAQGGTCEIPKSPYLGLAAGIFHRTLSLAVDGAGTGGVRSREAAGEGAVRRELAERASSVRCSVPDRADDRQGQSAVIPGAAADRRLTDARLGERHRRAICHRIGTPFDILPGGCTGGMKVKTSVTLSEDVLKAIRRASSGGAASGSR